MSEFSHIVPADDLKVMLKQTIQAGFTGINPYVDEISVVNYEFEGNDKTIIQGVGVWQDPEEEINEPFEFDFEVNVGTSSNAPVVLDQLEVVIKA